MKRTMLILLLSILGVSCTRQEMPGGTLRIVFETGAFQTKTDPTPTEGDAISITAEVPDLVILIARNSTGGIVATYPDGPVIDGALEGAPAATETSVSFSGLTGGETYTVYAFANTQGLWTMKNGETPVPDLTTIETAAAVEALQFRPTEDDGDAGNGAEDLDVNGHLLRKGNRLPLSAKGETTLTNAGNGEISLALKRCVAKVTAVFENQYGEDLTLTTFSNTFYHMNPATSYVVPHAEDFPVEQEDADDGNISVTIPSLEIETDQTYSSSWYVFPSNGPYTCEVSFTMADTPHYYPGLQVTDDHARDITQLARNQHLTITTRIGKGKQVSFSFEVSDWKPKTEKVTFN